VVEGFSKPGIRFLSSSFLELGRDFSVFDIGILQVLFFGEYLELFVFFMPVVLETSYFRIM